MAHADSIRGSTVYFDEVTVVPEDVFFGPDGQPLDGIEAVGPGASIVVDIDSDA